uniref:MRG domain-containing protein n=1 Tax=Bursaphelenchus xylophilus TaxID=6326 RepID=A0A1I7S2T5_BURXY
MAPSRRPPPKDAFASQKVTPKPVKKERKVVAENFSVGEKILCLHVASAIHYEAKIIDESKDPPSFRVHYQGWNKRYDEDVTYDDVPFRFNFYSDSSAAEAKEAQRTAMQNSSRKRARRDRERAERDRTGTPATSQAGSGLDFPGTATSSRSTTPDFRRKHRAGSYQSSENIPPRKAPKPRRSDSNKLDGDVVTIFTQPPPNLVEVLVTDKRKILEGFMVKVPEEYTVDHIVDLYVEKINNESQHVNADMFIEYDNVVTLEHTTAEMQKHIAYFIKDLFNHILKTSLLYGPEKKVRIFEIFWNFLKFRCE